MDQRQLAEELERITRLSPFGVENELNALYKEKGILKVLADLLAYDFPHEQKQMAAVAINSIVKLRLSSSEIAWSEVWKSFYGEVLCHPEVEVINWRHLAITEIACTKLLQQFESELCLILNPLFPKLSLKAMTLVFTSFLRAQTTQQIKFIFLRQNIEKVIQDCFTFICDNHDKNITDSDHQLLEAALVQALDQVMEKTDDSYQPLKSILDSLAMHQELFFIIVQELLYDQSVRDYKSLAKLQFSPGRMKELRFSSEENSTTLNTNKFRVLNILTSSIGRYDENSGAEDFQMSMYLSFAQQSLPFLLEQLIALLSKDQTIYRENILALLQLLRWVYRFNTLEEELLKIRQEILFKIVLPCFETSDQEYSEYRESPEGFYAMAEDLIENTALRRERTIKNMAGNLLEGMVRQMPDLLTIIIEFSTWEIRYKLLKEEHEQVRKAIDKYGYQPCIERALTVITLLAPAFSLREDMSIFVRRELFDLPQLLKLTGIDRARLFILLAYTYETLFKEYSEEGIRFLRVANESIEVGGTVAKSALVLFFNSIKVGFGSDIWQSLIFRIKESECQYVFRVMRKIVSKMLPSLESSLAVDLLHQLKGRLIKQFHQSKKETGEHGMVRASPSLLHCLDIVCQMTEQKQQIEKRPQLVEAMWGIFDLFAFAGEIQFEDNILHIFNNVLDSTNLVDVKYFQYFDAFVQIYCKTGCLRKLFRTYSLLLSKGKDHFHNHEQGSAHLSALLLSLADAFDQARIVSSLRLICILHHYTFAEYGSILAPKQDFPEKILNIFESGIFELGDETRASMINCLMMADWVWEDWNWSIINENSISIFRGYQGRLLAHTLRRMIQTRYNSDKVIQYLKYAIRLLHFWRESSRTQAPDSKYFVPKIFNYYAQLDPYDEVARSLNYLKDKLEPRRYDGILEEISSEVELGEVKDLLSLRVVKKNPRSFVRVKKMQ